MTDRIPFSETLMRTAELWAQRSTCTSLQVGCVISRDSRILVQGYNGVPSGMSHCDHAIDVKCGRAQHAERNAIAWAARHGIALNKSEMHTTHAPCYRCAMTIVNAGIVRVTYRSRFIDLLDQNTQDKGLTLLRDAGVDVRHGTGWV